MDPETDGENFRIQFDCSVTIAVVTEMEDPRADPAYVGWLPKPVGGGIDGPAEKSPHHQLATANVT